MKPSKDLHRRNDAWRGASALPVAVGIAAGAAWFGLLSAPPASAQPPDAPPHDAPVASAAIRHNARCVACHANEAREWAGDQHHTAFTDIHFQRAFAREPLPYCQSCHAPESIRPDAVADVALGVACVTCHPSPKPGDLDSAIFVPTPSHPAMRRADAGPSTACARCHQFPFPPGDQQPAGLMQRTVDEHAQSPFATVACAECHMPRVTTSGKARRSHAFLGGHTPDFVRSAAAITATRSGGRLDLAFQMRNIGHAFPTGDLFRRITIVAEALGPDQMVIADRSMVLARHFERRLGPSDALGKVEVRDDRLRSGERRIISLDLGRDAARLPIRFSVSYERLDLPAETLVRRNGQIAQTAPARVEGSVLLASGDLPPAR